VDLRARILAAGFAPAAADGGGERLHPARLRPDQIRAWAAALADLHRLPPPRGLPPLAFPDWPARLPPAWPVDVAPLLAVAVARHRVPPRPRRTCVCHRAWRLAHARFRGDRLVGVDGWQAAGRGDPDGDLAGVLVGLVADGASAALAEAAWAAFLAAYRAAGGPAGRRVADWSRALVGALLADALLARAQGEADPHRAGGVALWAALLARLLARAEDPAGPDGTIGA
jgi:hypothetical protein